MVTDGVNTSMTVAANPVLIVAPQEEVPSIKRGLIIYYAAAAGLVLVILIALLLRRRKKGQK
jgi:LPXTG-motif cell wall-anchored protein